MATLLLMALKEESQGLFEADQIFPFYCGVGQVKSAFWTHKLILERKPDRVINLGTAGSRHLPPGSLVECTSFVQRPANTFLPIATKTLKVPPISLLKTVCCGTGDFIDTATPLISCDVMDMESYAMAYVCQQLNTPFSSFKYVSDSSGPETATDWKKNLRSAAVNLLAAYKKISASYSAD